MKLFFVCLVLSLCNPSFAQSKAILARTTGAGQALGIKNTTEEEKNSQSQALQQWCLEMRQTVKTLKWSIDPCQEIPWQIGGYSVEGRPLVYLEIGNKEADNTTLVFATVHGDEITPFYLGIKLAEWLQKSEPLLTKTKVVIAPLINPDGFLSQPRRRMNKRGVDINRNFLTRDWQVLALKAWKVRYRSDPRRFPGYEPQSEPETLFQSNLIHQVRPQKILSIHSPLNFLDYDGPGKVTLSNFSSEYTRECQKLKSQLKAISGHFFPGSLGNYAGRELGIPTLTLELPSANPKKAESHWLQFQKGIQTMIHFMVPPEAFHQKNEIQTSLGKHVS